MKARLLLVLTLAMSLTVAASAQTKGMSMKGMSHKTGAMKHGTAHRKAVKHGAKHKKNMKKGSMSHGMKGMKMPMNHKM